MDYAMAWGPILVIPAPSAFGEPIMTPSPDLVWLVANWFFFWGIGITLLPAGIRQVLQPVFTARTIFRMQSPDAVTALFNGLVGIGAALLLLAR